jgi:hypothetical protein
VRRESESWREAVGTYVLATAGLILLTAGGAFGFLVQRSVSSSGEGSPEAGADVTMFVSYGVAVVGLLLIVCAFWSKARQDT